MKRLAYVVALSLVGSSAALAADILPPPPPPAYIPVVPPYNWSGFYIGGNLGAGWASASFSDTDGFAINKSTNASFLGGGQVGVNYEFWGGVVIGAEAMFDWAPNNGNTFTETFPGGGTVSATINNRWLTTATGKLGYAWDRVLLYGKAGGAWVGQSNSSLTTTGLPPFTISNSSNNNFGWTAGIGIEWAFWQNWSARAEYDFVGLNNQTLTLLNGGSLVDTISANSRQINMITVGINYTFGGYGY